MANNLGIGDLSTGISSGGMSAYIESLRASLISETASIIDDIAEIQSVIDAGWQGVAKDRFMQGFGNAREQVKADLQKEYDNLCSRLQELQNAYFVADQNIIQE